jgi:N4-gp56 family major capsid protein
MLSFDNLDWGGALTEGTHISTQALATNLIDITVQEYGNAVAATEFLLRTSFVDVMANATLLLAQDAARVLDKIIMDAALSTTNTVYPDSKTGRNNLDANAIMDTTIVSDTVEQLSTNKAPKFVGMGRDAYICICHPHQIRGLKSDSNWRSASEYAGSTQIFQGEIGRFDDVIFVETTMVRKIKPNNVYEVDGVAYGEDDTGVENTTGLNIYQSVMFGADAFGYAEALPVELRDNGVTDFGRERALAWYGIFASAILGTSGSDRCFVIETT